jgi:hypothetical protein
MILTVERFHCLELKCPTQAYVLKARSPGTPVATTTQVVASDGTFKRWGTGKPSGSPSLPGNKDMFHHNDLPHYRPKSQRIIDWNL